MDIKDKFDKGKESKTYQRIDSNYKVNIFLGYNEDGQMSMVLTEKGEFENIKSSKLIDVKIRSRDDDKLALYFDLLDNAYAPMFLLFCKDIIVYCESVGRNAAFSRAVLRWRYWRELFGKKRYDILDRSEIKGLIGELIQLKDFFIPKYGTKASIQSWMGPMLGHKDFEIEDTWYEVKSIGESSTQVTISSLEQLDSDKDGHLIINRLEETSSVSKDAINLNDIITQISGLIEDPEVLELFRLRLDNVGYEFNAEYENNCFEFKGAEFFKVSDSFPRLCRKNVNSSIGNAKYTLMLNGLQDYKEK